MHENKIYYISQKEADKKLCEIKQRDEVFTVTWLDINNDDVFQKVIEEIPNNLSKTQQIKFGKEKVKALFKYDKTYPRWVQSPEWPIVNGKPLVFSHQEKVKGDDCHTYYYFYDEQTKEQTIVEQFG